MMVKIVSATGSAAEQTLGSDHMDLQLSGKRALVTGGTKGIGRRIVDLLAEEGAHVALCARKAEEVDEAVAALEDKGVTATGKAVDVGDKDAYKAWIGDAAQELGGLDIFVPNVSAGGGMDGEENWYNNFEVDMMGAVRGLEAAMPHLGQSETPAVVFISTTAAVETFLAPQAYNAMKAALLTYAKQMAEAVAETGVRINVVSPGPVYFEGGAWNTIEQHMPELYKGTLAQCPMGRMAKPEEVARAVVFLASPAAAYITGTNLIVDGGFTKRVQF